MAFSRPPVTSPDSTFSATGAAAWLAGYGVAGADVGGIPYCPTATTETTSAKMVFDGTTFTLAMGTVTAAPGAILITQTRNTVGTTYDGIIKAVITDSNSAAGSLAMQILGGASGTTELLSLSKGGNFSVPGSGSFAGFTASNGYSVAGWYGGTSGADGCIALSMGSNMRVTWASSTSSPSGGNADTGISRLSAGVLAIGTSAAASVAGRLKLTSVIASGVAFASLNASPTAGEIQYVTDSSTATWGATIAGGGANKVLAWYNGTNWTVIGA